WDDWVMTDGSSSPPTNPTIATQPASQTVCAGNPVTFTVAATAGSYSGQLAYQWSKNGATISGATSASYTIASTVAGDAASTPGYTCVITSGCGSVTSSAATLTVNAATAI